MTRKDVWEQVYRRFDPFQPVNTAAWRAPRPLSPATEIERLVEVPFGEPRALVSGTIGTGKSTELLRIADARSRRDFVVVLDLVRHFSEVVQDEQALRNVEAWEVVFLAGLAVLRAANEVLPYPVPHPMVDALQTAWLKVAKATETPQSSIQLDIGGLIKSMVVVASASLPLLGPSAGVATAAGIGLRVLEGATGAVRWNVPIGQTKHRKPDQDPEMQGLLSAVNTIFGYVQSKATRILLVIDGLDRISELHRAEALFLQSEMIGQLACRLIVAAPFSLRSHPAASAIPRFSLVSPIVNEPVLDKKNPSIYGPGVGFFSDLFQRRVSDLNASDLIPQELLDRMAYYSGGRARDFVKSIRSLAEQAWLDDVPSATPRLVDKVLDSMRRLVETGLDEGHIKVLEHVMNNPRRRLPESEKARELLTYGQLLPYPNETEWYFPHPLLLMHMLQPT